MLSETSYVFSLLKSSKRVQTVAQTHLAGQVSLVSWAILPCCIGQCSGSQGLAHLPLKLLRENETVIVVRQTGRSNTDSRWPSRLPCCGLPLLAVPGTTMPGQHLSIGKEVASYPYRH